MKAQELNQDGSLRLDDQGKPIERTFSPEMWFRLTTFWGDRLRWKEVTQSPKKDSK